jgi:hypothetical protein
MEWTWGKLIGVGVGGALVLTGAYYAIKYGLCESRPDNPSIRGTFTAPAPWPTIVKNNTTFTFYLSRHKSLPERFLCKAEEIDEPYPNAKLKFTLINDEDAAEFSGPSEVSTDANGQAKITIYGVRDDHAAIHVHGDGLTSIKTGKLKEPIDVDSSPFETTPK